LSATPRTNRNARIATALVLVALCWAIPTVGAEDATPQATDDGLGWGECFAIDLWTMPPAVMLTPANCIPPT
jgi:hypothetical protein